MICLVSGHGDTAAATLPGRARRVPRPGLQVRHALPVQDPDVQAQLDGLVGQLGLLGMSGVRGADHQ